MSYSFFTILVSIFLFTDPGVNETQSTTNAAKAAVKKPHAVKSASKKTDIQKLHVFDSSPLTQTIFFN